MTGIDSIGRTFGPQATLKPPVLTMEGKGTVRDRCIVITLHPGDGAV